MFRYQWTKDRIRWMQNAAEYTDYHTTIAKMIADEFETPNALSIADGACGTGDFSIALSRHFKDVTSIDINGDVIDALSEKIDRERIKHVNPVLSDVEEYLSKNRFDLLFFSFYGDLDTFRSVAKNQKGAIFFHILPDSGAPGPNGAIRCHEGWRARLKELQEEKFPITQKALSIEFGQPFTDEADAVRYFMTHSLTHSRSETEARDMLKKLTPAKHSRFSLYLPFKKDILLVSFAADDLR